MRVLLTGASGFIGRHVLAQLALRGIDTVAVGGTRAAGFQGEFIEADLLQADACADVVGRAQCTHLIHMAWYAEHGQYWASPLNLRWVEASVRLVEAFCAAGGQHVAAAGTCAEYDGSVGYCREDSSPLVPATLYGVAKDATRRLLSPICDAAGVPLAWGRIFMAYGPGEDRRRLFPALADVFQGRRAPFGVNAGAYRDFLHVEDVARAFADLSCKAAAGSFNIASGQPIQIAKAVRSIARACGADPAPVLDLAAERPGEPHLLMGDNAKLLSLGWRPVHPFHP